MASKATVTITGPREALELLGQREVVLLPLEEYRAGAGRPLEEYLAERRERHRVQSRDGQQAS